MSLLCRIASVWRFYVDGFRNMTWGRPLWVLIILKLVILFAVLRVFFFEPVLAGKTDEEKSDHVGAELSGWTDRQAEEAMPQRDMN